MSIWNLSKGEIFFSGKITLYQNGVSKVWDGKYNLDSLDSNLDFLLMYFGQACFHPETTLLDKENHLYFRQPKDSHEQDLIYSARIIKSLSRSDWACKKEDSLFFGMVK